MRQNPYGTAPAENPQAGRVAMARNDPREHALIGAAWYAGVLAHAARGGLEAVTLAAVAGTSGVGRRTAALIRCTRSSRTGAALRGQPVRASRSSAPRDVQVTAVGEEIWLVNLTGRPRRVQIEGGAGAVLEPYAVTRLGAGR